MNDSIVWRFSIAQVHGKLDFIQIKGRETVHGFDASFKKLNDEVRKIYNVDRNEIKIYLNGKLLVIPEKAYIEDGTTMVPLRVITEEMDVKANWNGEDRSISITTMKSMLFLGKPIDVVLTIGSKQVQLGKYFSSIPVAPKIRNGVTFVPLSFIAQNLGLKVEWIGASSSVVLTSR